MLEHFLNHCHLWAVGADSLVQHRPMAEVATPYFPWATRDGLDDDRLLYSHFQLDLNFHIFL